MRKLIKTVSFILAAMICMAALSGCIENGNGNGIGAVSHIDDADVAARMNGTNISTYDVAIQMLRARHTLLMQGYDENSPGFLAAVREQAARYAATTVIYIEYAHGLGITIDDDDRAEVEAHVDNLIPAFGGEEAFREILLEEGFRDRRHVEDFFLTQDIFMRLMFEAAFSPEAMAELDRFMPEEELLGAKHILISYEDHGDFEAAEVFAQEILERALAGENFSELIATYGSDPGMIANPDGYTFVSGVMVTDFENTTRGLTIGEISGLVPTQFGIHIIKRVEPDPNNVMRPQGADESRIMDALYAKFSEMVDAGDFVLLPGLQNVDMPVIPEW